MMNNRQRWQLAKRAGFRTFLACWLASALFAAPLVAAHPAYAHSHSDETLPHLHSVKEMFPGLAAQVVPFQPLILLISFILLLRKPDQPAKRSFIRFHGIRAPPASNLC